MAGPVGVPALAGWGEPGRLKSVHQPVPHQFRFPSLFVCPPRG